MTSTECQIGEKMFINKSSNGTNNVSGKRISIKRKELNLSQRELADRLQLNGLDIDKNAIQRIESGKRFITDIEIVKIASVLNLSYDELLK